YGSWFSTVGPYAVGLAQNSGGIALAVVGHDAIASGSGPVVMMTDQDTFTDTNANTHSALLLNIIDYCTSGPQLSIFPTRGGDTGAVTVTVRGRTFGPSSTLTLRRAGTPDIIASSAMVESDATILKATVNLLGAARGQWDVVVDPGTGAPTTLQNGFSVEE